MKTKPYLIVDDDADPISWHEEITGAASAIRAHFDNREKATLLHVKFIADATGRVEREVDCPFCEGSGIATDTHTRALAIEKVQRLHRLDEMIHQLDRRFKEMESAMDSLREVREMEP